MADNRPQTRANHGKFVPGYHYVLSLLVLISLGWAVWGLIRDPGIGSAVGVATALALFLLFLYSRVFPLAVQDRLIRLEERLRLQRLAPPELHDKIDDLTPKQMVALRFASDDEVVDLARQVLDEGINADGLAGQKEIKRRIKEWRPDYHRM